MSKKVAFSIIFVFLFFQLSLCQAYAKELSVQKLLKTTDIKAGDDITIILKFSNPFGKPINVQIKDNNVVAGNGMNIQCLEYTVPKDRITAIEYAPIKAFSTGTFSIDSAVVTYTNPETGKKEEINSNSINVTVKPSQGTKNIKQQGITTIYQCNGVNMRSTSYSSSGMSTSIQINQNFSPNQQNTQQTQNPNIQQQDQDMNTLKKQMEKQLKQQKEMEKNLQRQIENSSAFQNMQRELAKRGYNPSSKKINAESNNTGSFEYTYKNKEGKKSTIRGTIENGTIKNIAKWGDEDKQRLMKSIEQNPKFRQLQNSLRREGYNLSSKDIKQPSGNLSRFEYTYRQEGREKKITGNVSVTGNVVSIRLEEDEESRHYEIWILITFLIALCLYAVYRKYFKKRRKPEKALPPHTQPELHIKPRNFRAEALNGIKHAENLFSRGEKRKAYIKLSDAVRRYFINTLAYGKDEMTSTEILKMLRNKNKSTHKNAKQCFDLCDLVKFAKYKPNAKDFRKAADSGRKAVLSDTN